MAFIEKGLVSTVVLQFLYCAVVVIMIFRARRGLRIPQIYKVAGLDAVDEAIGRATEMGKPVFFSPGIGSVSDAATLAGFAVLGYVARQCARFDNRVIVANRIAIIQPITEEIVRQAFVQEGKPDQFNPTDVRFLSSEQFAYASACVGIMNREHPAANIMVGYFFAESLILAEVGSQIGAIQIAGTTNTSQIPFFVAACDYCLIGEEIYAASAYLSRDPVLVGNLVAQDLAKMAGIAIIFIGALLATVAPKANWLANFLKM